MDKEKNSAVTCLAALSAAGVLALSVIFLFSPKGDFSENENRYLQSFPSLTREAVESGAFMEDINSYLCDHFPFRDLFISLKTRTELLAGRRKIGQVYVGEDGYLIEAYEEPKNTEQIGQILKNFGDELNDQPVEVDLMLVPTAVCIYRDKLPGLAFLGLGEEQLETAKEVYEAAGIDPIDCTEELLARKGEGQLYYKLDHHWTTFGAYAGYLAFCREKGLEPVALEDLEAETVTEDFRGTIYSKVNDYSRPGEEITIYTDPSAELTVFYEDTNETTDSLYALDYAQKKDKYSLFLNNLHPLIQITNEKAETDRELVLIKDSYANSMVPFLIHNFKRIYVFDTRYYKWGPSSFIQEHEGVTDVLLLYNMNTLDTDLGVRGIY